MTPAVRQTWTMTGRHEARDWRARGPLSAECALRLEAMGWWEQELRLLPSRSEMGERRRLGDRCGVDP